MLSKHLPLLSAPPLFFLNVCDISFGKLQVRCSASAHGVCVCNLTSSRLCEANKSWKAHLRQKEVVLGDEWSVT